MDYPFITSLQNVDNVSRSDWVEQVGPAAYASLRASAQLQSKVIVLGLEVDHGEANANYYNVKLPCGKVITGLSGFHLAHISLLAPPPLEKAIGCQYTIELIVDGATVDTKLAHDMMAANIGIAVKQVLEVSGFAGYKTTVGLVTYETSYPVE